jgi:creatinine amidohydrolase
MQLGERSWPQAEALRDKIVVVPLGSFEQHGHHLPLLTDSMIGSEIARRAETELVDEALFLPMLWLGASHHHLAFCGTVSLSSDTYIRVLVDVLESLIGAGFRRIFLLNAHAGNVVPANAAMQQVQLKHTPQMPDLWLVFASWFSLAAPQIAENDGLLQSSISHACEWETSQILQVRPDLVQPSRPATRLNAASQFFCGDYSRPSRVDVARRIEQSSPTGAFGFPEEATADKGEALFEIAAREVVAFVREFAVWPLPNNPGEIS